MFVNEESGKLGERPKILIVDDNIKNIISIEKILANVDAELVRAASGNEALSRVLEPGFALVLLDIRMPDMDGFETAELMRGSRTSKHIPIIFLSAISKGEEQIFKGYETGAVDYMFKPLDPLILQSKVNVFLELFRQKKELEKTNYELEKAIENFRDQQKVAIDEERLKVLLQLAGASAHELSQPLTSLLWNCELIEKNIDEPGKIDLYLTRVKEAGELISDTVKKIRTIQIDEISLPDSHSESDTIILDQKVKILNLENTDEDYEKMRDILKNEGLIDLSRAFYISEALDLVERQRFDMIFLDYSLDDGTGLDFMKSIKEKGIDVPVVVITGKGDEMLASRMVRAGAFDYLPKSRLSLKSVTRIINNTIDRANLKKELKRAREKMSEMSTIDEITGLYNRRYFSEALEREYARAKRYETPLMLLMIDIDHFKKVNDTYGHPCGDQVLTTTGKLLNQSKRLDDLACRYGGEEFAVILPNANREGAFAFGEKIRNTIAGYVFEYESHQFEITISIGLASSEDADSPDDLVKHTDKALYQAKETGRNRVVGFNR